MPHEPAILSNTDKYFTKTRRTVEMHGDVRVTYGVFVRRDCICAVQPAIDFITRMNTKLSPPNQIDVTRLHEEGSEVSDGKPLLLLHGNMSVLSELETLFLQKIGLPCVTAHNAYKMTGYLKHVAFLDMHARHAFNPEMTTLAAYGASVGSKMTKMRGGVGFIGSSTDDTAKVYGFAAGSGTTPHALIGYAGSTLEAMKQFVEANPNDTMIAALVDYFGAEYTDALEVADWFFNGPDGVFVDRTLGIRLDTHGGRFAEGLDWNKSVTIVCDWLHAQNEYDAVRLAMGDDAYEVATDDIKDRVRKLLFGPGVSAANIIHMRKTLDSAGFNKVKVIASSGFNKFKCKVMGRIRAPIDVVGTGSYLPDTMTETYATADIFEYDGKFSVKVGREARFQPYVGMDPMKSIY